MSLEQKIEALTAAVEALTVSMKAGGAAPAAGKTTKTEKATPAGYKAKHSVEEMQAALAEVKEKLGTPAAKAIITDIGKAAKMAEITDPETVDACYDAAKAKLQDAEDAM